MATQANIDLVMINLPSWREDQTDWDDVKISEVLDLLQGNVSLACRQFWVQRVSDTNPLTDITESGGSRPQSQSYTHAMEMLKYWDNNIAVGSYTTFGTIKRRYPRPRGALVRFSDYGYGVPYASTE